MISGQIGGYYVRYAYSSALNRAGRGEGGIPLKGNIPFHPHTTGGDIIPLLSPIIPLSPLRGLWR